jgi:hypothetical protein
LTQDSPLAIIATAKQDSGNWNTARQDGQDSRSGPLAAGLASRL